MLHYENPTCIPKLPSKDTPTTSCCRCAVDKVRMDINGSLMILCTDTVGKNTTTGRILQVIKGKDYGMSVRGVCFSQATTQEANPQEVIVLYFSNHKLLSHSVLGYEVMLGFLLRTECLS